MAIPLPRPRVLSSKCLGFAACRWNGVTIPDRFIESLKRSVDFVTVCPEMEIGLGVPRDPIRIACKDDTYRLMQLNTGRDVTRRMTGFASDFLASLGEVDGFILKDGSPSCGTEDVKVYPGLEPGNSIKRTSGFFAKAVTERFPGLPVETEARLTNDAIRERFLTRLFTAARSRAGKT